MQKLFLLGVAHRGKPQEARCHGTGAQVAIGVWKPCEEEILCNECPTTIIIIIGTRAVCVSIQLMHCVPLSTCAISP